MPEFTEINKSDALFTELALRLVGFDNKGVPFSFGTAFVIQPYLLVTAKHVVEEFMLKGKSTGNENEFKLTFWAIQVEWVNAEHNYNIWQVVNAYFSPHSDICLLHVGAYNDTAAKYKEWKVLPVSLEPPEVGEKITGFGFHATKFKGSVVSESGDLKHLELNDTSSRSIGYVKQVHMHKRDSVMLPFPCIEVDCRFDPGMSGGLVINSNSELCGVVCSSMPVDDMHYSHVALIWPIVAIEIDFGISNSEVKGVHRLLKLIEVGKWKPRGWENVKIEYLNGQSFPQVSYAISKKS